MQIKLSENDREIHFLPSILIYTSSFPSKTQTSPPYHSLLHIAISSEGLQFGRNSMALNICSISSKTGTPSVQIWLMFFVILCQYLFMRLSKLQILLSVVQTANRIMNRRSRAGHGEAHRDRT